MSDADRRETVYASDRLAARLEDLQFELGEGPCVEALATGQPVLVPDLHEMQDGRWPMFLDAARRTSSHALYSFPLQIGAIGVGVFDLYRDTPGVLSADALGGVLLCADLALWALLDVRAGEEAGVVEAERWLADMSPHSAQVHQATGMVVAQMGIPVESALAMLRAYAFAAERSLHDVARAVVERRLRLPEGMLDTSGQWTDGE